MKYAYVSIFYDINVAATLNTCVYKVFITLSVTFSTLEYIQPISKLIPVFEKASQSSKECHFSLFTYLAQISFKLS